jgi:hypothetical protein
MATPQRPFSGTTVRRDLMIIEGQRTTREIPAEARNDAGELVALDHTCHTPDYTGSIRWR